jgi:outer membrane protein
VKSLFVMRPVLAASLMLFGLHAVVGAQTAAAPVPGPTGNAAPLPGPTGNKVAVIEIQAAIFQTKDGQKALADLQTKFNPKKTEFERRRAEVAAIQEQYTKGANTLNEEKRAGLMRDIDAKTKALNRDTDDANQDLEAENQKIMNDLGAKMLQVINKYSTDKGYVLVLDVSAQTTPVIFASNTIDITRDVIDLYDKTASTLPARPTGAAAAPRRPVPAARP